MKNYIITIGREFGCGGREIGRTLASKLGIPFYDKDLVDMAAKEAGVNVDVFQQNDEVVGRMRYMKLLKDNIYGSTSAFYTDQAVDAQAKVIHDIADRHEPCIIFGRCGDYILREYRNVVNFFLYAPLPYRVKHLMELYHLNELDTIKLMQKVDRQRHNYYKFVTGKNRGDRDGKNMELDVSKFGVGGCVKMMSTAVEYLYDK